MPGKIYTFTVERFAERRSGASKLEKRLQYMAKRGISGARRLAGWRVINEIKAPQPVGINANMWQYRFTFHVSRETQRSIDEEIENRQFEELKRMTVQAGNVSGWQLANTDTDSIDKGNVTYRIASQPTIEPKVQISPREIPKDLSLNVNPQGYFDHIFDREAQIDVIVSSLITAVESNFKLRSHCVLNGDAATGKTTVMNAIVEMIGEENCYRIDATTSTQAGVLTDILEKQKSNSVKVLLIEEIEKIDVQAAFRWLLGVMDQRGELRICNSKVGYVQEPFPVLVIATVNDIVKFNKVMAGALASRFSNVVYFPKMDDDCLRRAIMKTVEMIHPKMEWVNAAIAYCQKYESEADIRRMASIVACGRERLINGQYQEILKQTSKRSEL
jgi:hypothetical protein